MATDEDGTDEDGTDEDSAIVLPIGDYVVDVVAPEGSGPLAPRCSVAATTRW